jgi:hypothetical protein
MKDICSYDDGKSQTQWRLVVLTVLDLTIFLIVIVRVDIAAAVAVYSLCFIICRWNAFCYCDNGKSQ